MRREPAAFVAVAILAAGVSSGTGCDSKKQSTHSGQSGSRQHQPGRATPAASSDEIPLPRADQRLCTGVVVLIDTSGSMGKSVRGATGQPRPKHRIAREALERIVTYTAQWQKSHADRVLQLGLVNFSSSASTLLPMKPFDESATRAALRQIPSPAGGTAIGEALKTAYQSLYASGCVRKYVLCITDGENTSGLEPDRVARQLFGQTGGEVELHFIAFDTSAEKFGFLATVNGHVVEAADEKQLNASLSEIYEKNILAEAMPAERE